MGSVGNYTWKDTPVAGSMVARSAEEEAILERYRALVAAGLRDAVSRARDEIPATSHQPGELLGELYAQIEYHFGWRDAHLRPATSRAGKQLRPTMLLLACDLAAHHDGVDAGERAARVRRAVPAAVAVELVHNFSLVHDDIEDGDEERHGRPTLWALWGVPQAINTGDGIFAMARLELLRLLDGGVAAPLVVELAADLDRTCLALCEGQFLDMRFEGRHELSVALYLEMIARKTAALMTSACRMGGRLGAPENPDVAERLGVFGRALGVAFQLRDDLLGIWEAEALGKSAAGDLRRKKVTLPVIAALEAASPADRAALLDVYTQPGPASPEQIERVLAILARVGARERARSVLREHCVAARSALEVLRTADGANGDDADAYDALAAMLDFVASDAQ